jgi:hypothetical protein
MATAPPDPIDPLKTHALVSLAELYGWPEEKVERIRQGDREAIAEARALQPPLGQFGY